MPTRTATGRPFRVTTTGPPSLAFKKALNWAFTSATDTLFTAPPPPRRSEGGPGPSPRWPARGPPDSPQGCFWPYSGGAPTPQSRNHLAPWHTHLLRHSGQRGARPQGVG